MRSVYTSNHNPMKAGQRYDICYGNDKQMCEGYIDEVCMMEGELTYIIHFWDKYNVKRVTTRTA